MNGDLAGGESRHCVLVIKINWLPVLYSVISDAPLPRKSCRRIGDDLSRQMSQLGPLYRRLVMYRHLFLAACVPVTWDVLVAFKVHT